jgi:choline-sulfatase
LISALSQHCFSLEMNTTVTALVLMTLWKLDSIAFSVIRLTPRNKATEKHLNMEELGIYSEHGSADEPTCHIPMIIRWPGMSSGVDSEFRYQIDLLPAIADLMGNQKSLLWDGESYADVLKGNDQKGREYLILSQCAHVCQRSVRFENYYYIRTYHDGMHEFPREMLFDMEADPHEKNNLAECYPNVCAQACRYLLDWEQEQMTKGDSQIDPLWTVMKEGGPFHAKYDGEKYFRHLIETGRKDGAERLRKRHPELFKNGKATQ